MAKETSTKSPSSKFNPAEFARVGNKQADTLMEMQKEIYSLIEQANRDWLARAEKERALASELATKLSAARSLPDVAREYQEWMTRRMEMMAEDGRKFFTDSQKIMNSTVRLMSKGWPSGGST